MKIPVNLSASARRTPLDSGFQPKKPNETPSTVGPSHSSNLVARLLGKLQRRAIEPEKTTPGLNLPARLRAYTWGDFSSGTVEHFIPGEIVVATQRPISPDTSLTVEVNGCVFEGYVLSCRPRDNGHEIHISINDSDAIGYRRTPRFLLQLPARLFNSDLASPVAATIVDISGDGLGLETATNLPVESAVAIESDSNIALGIVRYCQEQSEQVYRIGVKVHHVLPRLDRRQEQSKLSSLLSFGRRK